MPFLIKNYWTKYKESRVHLANSWRRSKESDDSTSSLLNEDEENTPFRPHRTRREKLCQQWPWMCSNLFLACTTIFLYIRSIQNGSCIQGYREGFETDLRAVGEDVELKQVRFNGALNYNESGSLIREHVPGEPVWVGDPNPEIDALWDHVESASMVFLEGREADQSREHTSFFNGYWLTGLDVFHQLHCLNQVRKAFYPEYYIPVDSPRTHKLHFEHCLDYVRQALMCNADITPVTHKFYQSADIFGPDFNTLHTCRNFNRLLEWSLDRNSEAADRKGTGSEITSDTKRIVDKEHVAGGHDGHNH